MTTSSPKRVLSTPSISRSAAPRSSIAGSRVHQGHEQERLFVWVHVYDPHARTTRPPFYASVIPDVPTMPRWLIPILLSDRLTAVNDDRTAVIVISDHGEGLGDHASRPIRFSSTTHDESLLLVKRPECRPASSGDAGSLCRRGPTIWSWRGFFEVQGRWCDCSPGWGSKDTEELSAYGETFGTLYQFNWSELRFLRKDGFKFIEAPGPSLRPPVDPAKPTTFGRRIRPMWGRASPRARPGGESGKTSDGETGGRDETTPREPRLRRVRGRRTWRAS
jgi:hypothetical protein